MTLHELENDSFEHESINVDTKTRSRKVRGMFERLVCFLGGNNTSLAMYLYFQDLPLPRF